MNEIMEIVIRGVTAFVILMLLAQMMGKQMIGKMSYQHYIAAITLGSIAGNTVFNIKIKFGYFLLSLLIFSILTLAFSFLTMKMHSARKWFTGQPITVMENGQILEHNMKKVFYTLDALNHGLRKKDIFNINEVEYAVLEPDGSLSVLKKEPFRGVVKSDLSLVAPSRVSYAVEVIREGKVLQDNMAAHGLTEEWLSQQLSDRGVTVRDVFYGAKDADGCLFLDKYKDDPMV